MIWKGVSVANNAYFSRKPSMANDIVAVQTYKVKLLKHYSDDKSTLSSNAVNKPLKLYK